MPEDADKEEQMFFAEDAIALIKPDAAENAEDIIAHLETCGFTVRETRDVELSSEIASKIYAGKAGEAFFDELVDHMTSGSCKVLVLSEIDAVEKLRNTMGDPDPEKAKNENPNSIRAKLASSIIANAIHAPTEEEDIQLHFQLLLN